MSVRRLHLRGLRVSVELEGRGPPVVFAHGGLGNRQMWGPQVRALSGRYATVTYDLRGHGETTGGRDVAAYAPALLAEDLAGLVDALALERFSLVGLSLGGLLAQEYVLAHPGRVHALVLADTWAATAPDPRLQMLGRVLSPVVVAGLRLFGTGPLVGLATAGFGPDRTAEAALIAAATAGTNRDDAVRVWLGLGGHDLRARLPEISAPTLVLVGERDHGRSGAEELVRLVPGARQAVVAGAAHNSNLHAPEAFSQALGAFLDEVEAASPSEPWIAPDEGS